jgi:hypothetical protein
MGLGAVLAGLPASRTPMDKTQGIADRSLKVNPAQTLDSRFQETNPPAANRKLPGNQSGQFSQASGVAGQGNPFSPQGLNSMMAGNMMVGNAMMHPLVNPFSIANPFSPMSPGNPFSPLNPLNQHRPASRFVTIDDDDILNPHGAVLPVDLAADVFDDEQGLRVINRCASVKTQALEIANRLMKKQNNKIFKELVSYLIKAKFLIGMTEIKLTRSLRKRVFGLMTAFSSLDHSHFNFVDPEPEEEVGPLYSTEQFASVYPSLDDHDPDGSNDADHLDNDTKI